MRSGTATAMLLATTLVLTGCTHRQLTRSAVSTTSTVMDIEYRIVLTNLALLAGQPASYPSHIDLADGVIQINDRVGFGNSGGFTTFGGSAFGIDRFGPDAQRQITEQWGADATTDPQRLTDLQDLYRVALGLMPLPPPNAIAYLRAEDDRARVRLSSGESSSGAPSPTSSGGGGSTPSAGSSSGSPSREVPIEILLSDVPPPGWFHIGCKKDVPKDACYVGNHGDRYAWVTAEGIPALARFTVTVQSVVKFKPGDASPQGKHGLAFTR